jgi:hypothetical protein
MNCRNDLEMLIHPRSIVSEIGRALNNEAFFSTKEFVEAVSRPLGSKNRGLLFQYGVPAP